MSKHYSLREATVFPPPSGGRRNQLIRLQLQCASGPLLPDKLTDSSSAAQPPLAVGQGPRRRSTRILATSASAFNVTNIRRQIGGEMADDPPPPPLVSSYLSAARIPSMCHGGAAGVSKTSQRWIKPSVKLPL